MRCPQSGRALCCQWLTSIRISLQLGSAPGAPLWSGVYGWLVPHVIYNHHSLTFQVTFANLRHQAGETCYRTVSLEQSGTLSEEPRSSSLSPCGAYICKVTQRTAQIQVTDLRSGDLVFKREFMPANEHMYQAAVCWSSCGSRLMVLVGAYSRKDAAAVFTERLFICHFC